MPKASKPKSIRKCEQCRKDRQKCLPEDRLWPGTRCGRCQRYNHACSASRTQLQEQAVPIEAASQSASTAASLSTRSTNCHVEREQAGSADSMSSPPTSPPVPRPSTYVEAVHNVVDSSDTTSSQQIIERSDIQCLQELGDIIQLRRAAGSFNLLDDQGNIASEMIDELEIRHNKITTDLHTRAQRHQTDGRYQGAEYIYRTLASKGVSHAYKDPIIPEDHRSVLVSVYEGLGDFPTAEIVQLRHLTALALQDASFFDEEVIQEAKRMARLFSLFQERIRELDPELSIYATLSIFYRAAVLDLAPLSALLYDFHLELGGNGGQCRSLHVAAQNGAANMMHLLLAWGGDINCRSPSGATPLLTAAWHGKVDMVQQLLESKADAQATDDSGRTALHMASRRVSGENDINVYILKILLQWKSNIEAANTNGETALVTAITLRHYREARFLLSQGANTEVQYCNNKDTLLIEAAREGWCGGLLLLLDHKANQRAKNNDDETALFAAVDSGRKTIVEILLEYGVWSSSSTVKEDASLYCAIMRRNEPIAKILIDAGANLDFRSIHGWTPLHLAIYDGEHCEQIYMKLLEKGAHIDSQDADGNTPLHLAVEIENPKTVQNLLGAGASIVIENYDLKSPYGIGIQHPKNENAKEIANMLEESMAAFVSRFPSPPIVRTAPTSPLSNLPPLPSFSRLASHLFSTPSMGYSTHPPTYFNLDRQLELHRNYMQPHPQPQPK